MVTLVALLLSFFQATPPLQPPEAVKMLNLFKALQSAEESKAATMRLLSWRSSPGSHMAST